MKKITTNFKHWLKIMVWVCLIAPSIASATLLDPRDNRLAPWGDYSTKALYFDNLDITYTTSATGNTIFTAVGGDNFRLDSLTDGYDMQNFGDANATLTIEAQISPEGIVQPGSTLTITSTDAMFGSYSGVVYSANLSTFGWSGTLGILEFTLKDAQGWMIDNWNGIPYGHILLNISAFEVPETDVSSFVATGFVTIIEHSSTSSSYLIIDTDGDTVPDYYDNCSAVANTDQADMDIDGIGDVCDGDLDGDGSLNGSDNCPATPNADQANNDGDSAGDVCDADDDNDNVNDALDNCVFSANADQSDVDGDGAGDACDNDKDGDTVLNSLDNCPVDPNALQEDLDGDTLGDACDVDDDNDTVLDNDDNCPVTVNTDQADLDGDNIGDACDADRDGDGKDNDLDNCPVNANPTQEDSDADGAGNACDADDDNDGIADNADNCSLIPNPDQSDLDADGQGDACDGDWDGDGIHNDADNCPTDANSMQSDTDGDGIGDACETDSDNDGVLNDADICAGTLVGAVVDSGNGCSIAQLCPCDNQRGSTEKWRNHGKFVSCTSKTSESFVGMGLITDADKDDAMSAAGQSSCGSKK